MRGAVWLVAVIACGDNLRVRDAAPDVARMPDLALVAAEMNGTAHFTTDTFDGSACEVVEGCIGSAGTRRLLRFATVTENVGNADLDLGPVPPDGVSAGVYVWSPCHMHHHVAGYANFELHDASGLVVGGHKQAFCLEDDEQVTPIGPSHGFTCKHQGISPGWADNYAPTLPCQWIDVTGVPPGTYTLRVVIDPQGALPDADASNNTWMTDVIL